MIKLKSVPNDIAIIQAYMPITQANDGEVEEIYEKIEELISLTNSKENLIIMGDWNAIVGENIDGREVGKYGLGTRNERGDRLVEFCRQHDLIITNTLFMNHKRRRYTFKMPGADIDSDHNLVMIKSLLKFKKLERPKNKGHDWNLCQLKQPEIRKLFEKKMQRKT
ncbi:craniofacial development protein 2-like [Sipha flava]|uniref:Craniofacial development protein 2-like n=1 Tax=Sipha flava TaxID=143950 RepID=A0A8B8GR25_9HEMI|nr:craniofacial development protein 2-like [Sipha flava]